MKVRLAQISNMESSLRKLMDKELPVKTAYRLGKLARIIGDELSLIEESRVRLIKKYGSEVEPDAVPQGPPGSPSPPQMKGKQIQVNKEREPDFFREYNTLLQEEIEIIFDPVPLVDLGETSFTPADIVRLEGIIGTDEDFSEIKKVEKEEEVAEVEEEVIEEAKKTEETK